MLSKLSDSDYHVKKLTGNKRVLVVHFNHLKLCTSGTRFGVDIPNPVEEQSPALSQGDTSCCSGANMGPLECNDVDELDGLVLPQ